MTPDTYKDELKFRVIWMIEKQRRDFSILLFICSLLLSFGFTFGTGNNENYSLIYSFGGATFWSVFFFIHSIIRLLDQLVNIPRWVSVACSVSGIWAWNYIFLSFVVFDTSAIAPTEFLLLVPTIAEFWLLLSTTKTKR